MDTVVKSCHRPCGLSLQGTIPSFSAMVFSCLGGAFFKAICWLRAHQQQGLVAGAAAAAGSSAAATTEVAAETQLPRAAKSWKFVFFN